MAEHRRMQNTMKAFEERHPLEILQAALRRRLRRLRHLRLPIEE